MWLACSTVVLTCVMRGVPPRSKRRKQPWLVPPTCQQSACLPSLMTYLQGVGDRGLARAGVEAEVGRRRERRWRGLVGALSWAPTRREGVGPGVVKGVAASQRQVLKGDVRVVRRGRRQSSWVDDAVQPGERARESLDNALRISLDAHPDRGCAHTEHTRALKGLACEVWRGCVSEWGHSRGLKGVPRAEPVRYTFTPPPALAWVISESSGPVTRWTTAPCAPSSQHSPRSHARMGRAGRGPSTTIRSWYKSDLLPAVMKLFKGPRRCRSPINSPFNMVAWFGGVRKSRRAP